MNSTLQDNMGKISIIIPTINQNVLTIKSIPNDVETIIEKEGNRSEARNVGAKRATKEILVFCDDDIIFDVELLNRMIEKIKPRNVIGLEDYDFNLLLTRFLMIYKDDFNKIGGFDENFNHMEDTDFCFRAKKAGYNIIPIPREIIQHKDHPTRVGNFMRWSYYIKFFYKYKLDSIELFSTMIKRKILG